MPDLVIVLILHGLWGGIERGILRPVENSASLSIVAAFCLSLILREGRAVASAWRWACCSRAGDQVAACAGDDHGRASSRQLACAAMLHRRTAPETHPTVAV